jgi:hypothetical protein
MVLNIWWKGDPAQRFWLEITDREDAGESLVAPQLDGGGQANWSYALVSQVQPGDRVLHYKTNADGGAAIIGWSEAIGSVSQGTITWQAHGSRGRARGHATTGPSWFVPLSGLNDLDSWVRGKALGAMEVSLMELREELEHKHGRPTYFPFFRYRPGEIRAQQGYLVKWPTELFGLLPETEPARSESEADIGTKLAEDAQPRKKRVRRGKLTRVQDPILRSAIENHAVDMAMRHYKKRGGASFLKLGKPYDIKFELAGAERHVEVKGSSLLIETVELTINEVVHAADFQPTDLVVVDDIKWERRGDGSVATTGGRVRVWSDWKPLDEDLAVRRFAYYLPEGGDSNPR